MGKLVSKVYADALIDAALDTDSLDTIYEEMLFLSDIFSLNTDLGKLLDSPKITKEEKLLAIKEIFLGKVSDETIGLLKAMIQKDREAWILETFDYIIATIKEHKGIGIAYITSAYTLDEEKKKSIEEKLLETTTYQTFELHYDVKEEIIGGLIIRIKDRVLDSSVRSMMTRMKRELA